MLYFKKTTGMTTVIEDHQSNIKMLAQRWLILSFYIYGYVRVIHMQGTNDMPLQIVYTILPYEKLKQATNYIFRFFRHDMLWAR